MSFLLDSSNVGKFKERNGLLVASIYSDLPLPQQSMLLERPELIKDINEAFQGAQEIKTVALVGIGGSGKTTLARQYALSQTLRIVWEINAETKESVIHSFEKLAYALSQTEEERKILREIHQIQNFQEKEEKIILFVKNKLKNHSPWLLIFDNVECFSDLKQAFPSHSLSWGKGYVIVTTRDSNIQNNTHITHAISIGELKSTEKLTLFEKIMTAGNPSHFTTDQQGQAEDLLTHIPSFPLDISIATNYLKATHQPFESYINKLSNYNKDFLEAEENTLRDSLDSPNTRYSIISASLKKIIDKHPDFSELLLFVSLLDSQDIPRSVLNKYKNEAIVDNLIYHLKKYSLIITSPGQKEENLSIHRSTQRLSLAYFTKMLNLEKNKDYL
ncbi:MAG: hypothetical protein K0M45_07095 [Candidatus Paracaedibacteraceae bacterium]|nr:hypothetical protein [Candidatus Paracaedibacteraceae bacterium]